MSYEFVDQLSTKVKHNFKQYVLLTSRNLHFRLEFILETICGLNGYKSHKAVKYEENSSHIHVKFEEEYMAKEAVDFLINLNPDLTVVLVDDMLREWYSFEKNYGRKPWTITVVDIIGNPPFGVNFLTEPILYSVFRDFCNPYVLPYTAAINEPHVQVMFGSMTEALAACIAFGEWWVKDSKMDSFCFRVRINPSDYESSLICSSGGTPEEAFKLDYFVNLGSESNMNNKLYTKQNMAYNYLQNMGLKMIQRLPADVDPNPNKLSVTNGNFICLPVIAPFNSYAQALMASNKTMNAEASSVLPDFQSTQNTKGTEDEKGNWPSIRSEDTVDSRSSAQGSNPGALNDCFSSEMVCSDLTLDTVKNIKLKPDLIPPTASGKPRRICKKAHLKRS